MYSPSLTPSRLGLGLALGLVLGLGTLLLSVWLLWLLLVVFLLWLLLVGVGVVVVDGLFEAEGFGLGMALIFFAKTLNSMRTDGTSLLIPCNPYSALPTACADREWGEMSMAWASTDSSSWICRLLLVMF